MASQRISASGVLLDPQPTNFVATDTSQNGCFQYGPGGAAVGTSNALIVFLCPSGATPGLYGLLLPFDGSASILGTFPIHTYLNNNAAYDNAPTVAFDGTNFLVAWANTLVFNGGSATSIVFSRISTSGTVLDAVPVVASSAGAGQAFPALAFDGTNYLLAWRDSRLAGNVPANDVGQFYGTRVTPAGALLDGTAATGGFPISANDLRRRSRAVLAFDGTEYILVWGDEGDMGGNGQRGIVGARISPSGAAIGTAGFEMTISGPPSGSLIGVPVMGCALASPGQVTLMWNNGVVGAGSFFSTIHP